MKKLFVLLSLAGLLCSTSCSETYDDSALTGRVDDLENRVARLEELCRQMNTNIASLQTLVSALQDHDCITSMTPVESGGSVIGYTIAFSQHAPVTIYHGRNGADGVDGKDGAAPVIGVMQDTDGAYYWTLDGEWLTDEAGAKIRTQGPNGVDGRPGQDGSDGKDGADGAPGQDGSDGADGKDGQDGVTPRLKIENNGWYVSYNNGTNWTYLGQVPSGGTVAAGDSMFRSVDASHTDYVLFTLSDGTEIRVPKFGALAIDIKEGYELLFDIDEAKTINYTITGGSANNVVKAEMQNIDGVYTLYTTATSATKGTIKITAKVPTANNVIVSVSNGTQTIMTAIAVSIKPSLEENVITVETPGTLSKLLAGYDKTTITELTIIGSLNDSDIYTLKSLPNLAILDLENVNLELPDYAFYDKTSLTSVKLPRTLKTIGRYAFNGCSSLTSITIPDGVTTIGDSAFFKCNSLTGVYITDIAKWCAIVFNRSEDNPLCYAHNLYLNGELVTELIIPDNVTTIGEYAFYGCSCLTSVTIPNSIPTIGKYAFNYCNGLTSVHITDMAKWCTAEFQFRSNPLHYAHNLYVNGELVTAAELIIPDNVTTIGMYAFDGCSSLTSITIPDSVAKIGDYAFSECTLVTSIYCKAHTPPTIERYISDVMYLCTLYVPTGCKDVYATADEWKKAKEIIEMEF